MSAVLLTEVAESPIAVIRMRTTQPQLTVVVPKLCGDVWNFLRGHGLKGGRNVAVYLNSAMDIEVGVEFSGDLPASDTVVRSKTPAGLVASTTHLGPYRELGAAYTRLTDWVAAKGYKSDGPSWELYGHWEKAWDTDPSKIRTDIFVRVSAV